MTSPHTLDHYAPPPDLGLSPLYLDHALLALDKPSGLLTVPGRGAGMDDCLIARAQRRWADALVVHRLDMATSGVVLFGRGAAMQRALSLAFQDRATSKRYIAVVSGLLRDDEGEVDLPLITDWPNRPRQKVDRELGKPSLTRYRVLARDAETGTSRVELEPVTGRSHQLRVHLLALGHPILGDTLYGDVAGRAPRLLLHATLLELDHPDGGQRLVLSSAAPF